MVIYIGCVLCTKPITPEDEQYWRLAGNIQFYSCCKECAQEWEAQKKMTWGEFRGWKIHQRFEREKEIDLDR